MYQTAVATPELIDCGVCFLQRYTAQEFVIIVDGERAGLVRMGAGMPTEIGFVVFEAFRGRGIATAAVKTLTDAVLDAGHVNRVVAVARNADAMAVLRKAGFRKEQQLTLGELWVKECQRC